MKKMKTKNRAGAEVTDVELLAFAREHYKRYGLAVLEDRAIPDYRDGLNPVNRRTLWAAFTLGVRSNSKYVKSARVVGDVIGRYHPHGDSAAYGAMVKMTNVGTTVCNTPIGLMDGEGNWSSMSNGSAAAMRYTEVRLSKFSDEVLFNKFYMPVVKMVPNFDSSTEEPLILPALLPVVLLNGRFGIAPGATTNIPSMEPRSLLKVLAAAYQGKELTPKFLASTLRLVSTFGGVESDEALADPERRAIFKSTRGRTTLSSTYEFDEKKRTLTYTRFAVDSLPSAIDKLMKSPYVQHARDGSSVTDKYGTLEVMLKRVDDSKLDHVIEKVDALLTSRENVVLNFTIRSVSEDGQSQAVVKPMILSEMLTRWVKWRTNLEVKACKYWIGEDDKEIRRLELLCQAVDLLDFLVSLLKNKKLTQQDVYQAYAKKAKIELEESKYVLNRPIISLRNLERVELEAKIEEIRKHRSELVSRSKNPEKFMLGQLKHLRTLIQDSPKEK